MKRTICGLLTIWLCIMFSINVTAYSNNSYEYSVLNDDTIEITSYHGYYSTVNIPSRLYADSRELPVSTIGSWAFENCDYVKSVKIPDTVTTIEEGAFSGCNNLESITIPDSVITIEDFAFQNCTSLNNLTLSNHLESIGMQAFENCINLSSVVIPDQVSTIKALAFFRCSGLTFVSLGENVSIVEDGAFYNCTSLHDVNLGKGVKKINNGAFLGCTALTNILHGENVTDVGSLAFYNTPWLDNHPDGLVMVGKALYSYSGNCPSKVTIPDGTTSISPNAFDSRRQLTEVTLPTSVERIGVHAFHNCTSLKSISLFNPSVILGYQSFGYRFIYRLPPVQIDGFTIYGYPNSTGQEYALENSFTFIPINDTNEIILGDTDGDGDVTIVDATVIQRHLASIPTAVYIEAAADADQDGSVTIIDATAIQRWLVQLPSNENIGKLIV